MAGKLSISGLAWHAVKDTKTAKIKIPGDFFLSYCYGGMVRWPSTRNIF